MNSLIQHNKYEQFKKLLLYSYALFLPFSDWFSFRLNNAILILLSIIWFGETAFKKFRFDRIHNSFLLFSGGIFLIQMFDFLHEGNLQKAGANLFMKLPFLLFPLVLSVFSLTEQMIKRIQYLFVGGCTLAILMSFRFLLSPECADADWKQYAQYEEYLILHRPYFGIYLLLAVCILYDEFKRKFNALSIFLLTVFVAFIILIQAKMSIITLFILFVAEARLISNQKIRKTVMLTLSALIGVGLLVATVYYLNQRVNLKEKQGTERFLILSVNTRLEHYACAFEIVKENMLSGVGSGNLAPMMDSCYNRNNSQLTRHGKHFNVHNEFLEETARHGIFGLSVYLVCFLFFFTKALRKKDNRYLQLLLIIVLASVTETVFSRAQGVLMFSFFNALLFLKNHKNISNQPS